jgi:hypothetical protein
MVVEGEGVFGALCYDSLTQHALTVLLGLDAAWSVSEKHQGKAYAPIVVVVAVTGEPQCKYRNETVISIEQSGFLSTVA